MRTGLSSIFTILVGSLAAWSAVLRVAERVADADPPVLAWLFGGLLAVLVPPAPVVTGGWFASQGPRDP
ncbi:hypothetical protein AB0B31_08030 [Catellatospora citrea]|uniref:hypothetical protein n=1 Tax=Catellatospora citrea TaxID=53366 RepID=UPI0033C96C85